MMAKFDKKKGDQDNKIHTKQKKIILLYVWVTYSSFNFKKIKQDNISNQKTRRTKINLKKDVGIRPH